MNKIPGYSRLLANEEGKVFVAKARGHVYDQPIEVKGRINACGYRFCGVRADRDCDPAIATPGREGQLMHILICLAFHGLRPTSKHEVDHINGVRSDNRPSNLRWVTRAQNLETRQQLRMPSGTKHHNAKLTDSIVREIRRLRSETDLTYREISARFGVNLTTAHRAARSDTWGHIANAKNAPSDKLL